jgi:hypothetical protein
VTLLQQVFELGSFVVVDDPLDDAPHGLYALVANAQCDDRSNDEAQGGTQRDADGEKMVAIGAHGSFVPLANLLHADDRRCFGPQLLESIIVPLRRRKDVHDHIAIVD